MRPALLFVVLFLLALCALTCSVHAADAWPLAPSTIDVDGGSSTVAPATVAPAVKAECTPEQCASCQACRPATTAKPRAVYYQPATRYRTVYYRQATTRPTGPVRRLLRWVF